MPHNPVSAQAMSADKKLFEAAEANTGQTISKTDLDAMRYKKNGWDRKLLLKLEMGPLFMTKEDAFDLPTPPANSSEETQKELAYVHELAETMRTPFNKERIIYEDVGWRPFELFQDIGLIHDDNFATINFIN